MIADCVVQRISEVVRLLSQFVRFAGVDQWWWRERAFGFPFRFGAVRLTYSVLRVARVEESVESRGKQNENASVPPQRFVLQPSRIRLRPETVANLTYHQLHGPICIREYESFYRLVCLLQVPS